MRGRTPGRRSGAWREAAVRAALLVVIAGALGACLGDPPVTPAPTARPTPEPTPTTTAYEIGQAAWYEGLVLHVDRAVATLDRRGGPVEVTIRIENPNDDAGELDGAIRLFIGGTAVEATRESRIPTVPGHDTVSVLLTYELQAIASADDAVIEIGAAPLHVARIPLSPGGEDPVTFEPVAMELSGRATSAALRITLQSGVLRWDLPDWSQELDADLAALTLTYDVTYAGDFPGGLAFTGENVALRLPDGSVVEPRRDGHSQSVELVGPRKTKTGLFSRFEIPNGMIGEFALLVRNSGTEKAIVFTIEG